jgi:RNA polymerase sigma factor (sigma-70 family)
MSNRMLAAVSRVRLLAGALDAEPSDAQLVTRFILSRDEEAFAALVNRHGPMVKSVCRRVAGDPHLADDAFQATFMVLAKKAGAVNPRGAVRSWLYGVAVRCARDCGIAATRRRRRETPVPCVPEQRPSSESSIEADMICALHEEIARLPDHLRGAVILCELDGASRKNAASRLGIPEGTLSSRLAKARAILVVRLKSRGITLPGIGLSALLCRDSAAAAITDTLRRSVIQMVCGNPTSGAASNLARGVLRTMSMQQFRQMTAGTMLVVAFGLLGLWGIAYLAHAENSPKDQPVAKAKVDTEKKGRIYFEHGRTYYSLEADGTDERMVELPVRNRGAAIPSPDGKSLAYWLIPDGKGTQPLTICIRELAGNHAETRIEVAEDFGFIHFCWSPSGQEIHLNLSGRAKPEVRHFLVDIKNKKTTLVKILPHHLVTDWSPDGKYLLTTGVGNGRFWHPKSLHLMKLDGTEHLALTRAKDSVMNGRLSPDGKRILCRKDGRLAVMVVGKPDSLTSVEGIAAEAEVAFYTWSPDGSQIAYTLGSRPFLESIEPEDLKDFESRLIVADPNGKNAKMLRSARGKLIGPVEWR